MAHPSMLVSIFHVSYSFFSIKQLCRHSIATETGFIDLFLTIGQMDGWRWRLVTKP